MVKSILHKLNYGCYVHQTYTICSLWYVVLLPHGGLCPKPTFHAWVTMIRKKWVSLFYRTYGCYINQTYTVCSSWHDILIARAGLCPWSTFHAWVAIVTKKWLSPHNNDWLLYSPNLHHLYILTIYWCHLVVCVLWPTCYASVSKT